MIQLKIIDKAKMKKIAPHLHGSFQKGVQRGLDAVGMKLTNIIKKDLTKPSTGSARDIRYNPRRKVKVSPAGKSPNSDRGELRSSMAWNRKGVSSVFVGSLVKKGAYLEHGTKRMRPRPFIEVNAKKNIDLLSRTMIDKVLEQIEGENW